MTLAKEGFPVLVAPSSVREYSAAEHLTVKDMLPAHRRILERIVSSIYAITAAELEPEGERRGESIRTRDPNLNFLIDGQRGSGKTSLLYTTHRFLNHLDYDSDRTLLDSVDPDSSLYKTVTAAQDRSRREGIGLAYCLPVVRPDDLEESESIMEAIFSRMIGALQKVAEDSATDPDRQREAKQLETVIKTTVAKGWYFSRQLGVEALLSDSLNFDEYIRRRVEQAKVSHDRDETWSGFVSDFLKFFRCHLLCIAIDDMDVSSPAPVDEVVRNIRIFFSHPQIVVLAAANVHSIRQRLLMKSFSALKESADTLRDNGAYTAVGWRDFEREQVEQLLAKVFPRPMRHFITLREQDRRQLLSDRSFHDFCREQMALRLEHFVRRRGATRLESPTIDRSRHWDRDVPELGDLRSIESYLSLWLLANFYFSSLTPATARHLNHFRAAVAPSTDRVYGTGFDGQNRRVAVALFTDPQNFSLVQRLGDTEGNVLDWLRRQKISASWRGNRWIRVNGLELGRGSPSYDYLLFRLDLEMTKPDWPFQNADYPFALYPTPAGDPVPAPEVWETRFRDPVATHLRNVSGLSLRNGVLRLQQELHGIARLIGTPVISANCTYFKDLSGIPDIAWAGGDVSSDGERPERRLWNPLTLSNLDATFRLDRYDHRNRYFRDVVMMFGSYPLVHPVREVQYLYNSTTLLGFETEHSDVIDRATLVLERLYEQAAYSGKSPLDAQAFNDAITDNFKQVGESQGVRERETERSNADYVRQFLAPRYHRILCDVRRAYHALRVLEHDLNSYAAASWRREPKYLRINLDHKGTRVSPSDQICC